MKQMFLPAILPTTFTDRWQSRPLNWMDLRIENMDCYYPKILMSYYHWQAIRRFRFANNAYRFGDSGGYSIATQGAFIDPREVVAMLRTGGDLRWLGWRAMARHIEERRSGELETAAAAKELDMTAFIRAATEIH